MNCVLNNASRLTEPTYFAEETSSGRVDYAGIDDCLSKNTDSLAFQKVIFTIAFTNTYSGCQ